MPDDIEWLLAWVDCVAGAGTSEDYMKMLSDAGFANFHG